jgi:hypothetical protein
MGTISGRWETGLTPVIVVVASACLLAVGFLVNSDGVRPPGFIRADLAPVIFGSVPGLP